MSNIKEKTDIWLERVKTILTIHPETKDCDWALYYFAIEKYCSFNPDAETAHTLLKMMSTRKLPSPKTIERIRRKLQADFPELRGENYNKRKDNEEEIVEALGYTETPFGAPGTTP